MKTVKSDAGVVDHLVFEEDAGVRHALDPLLKPASTFANFGKGRAVVMLGLQAIDEFWKKPVCDRVHAMESRPDWQPGMPAPDGYYRSAMYPGMVFRRAA